MQAAGVALKSTEKSGAGAICSFQGMEFMALLRSKMTTSRVHNSNGNQEKCRCNRKSDDLPSLYGWLPEKSTCIVNAIRRIHRKEISVENIVELTSVTFWTAAFGRSQPFIVRQQPTQSGLDHDAWPSTRPDSMACALCRYFPVALLVRLLEGQWRKLLL